MADGDNDNNININESINIPRSTSEPDLSALASIQIEDLPQVLPSLNLDELPSESSDVHLPTLPPVTPLPIPIPPALPSLLSVGSVSFSDYVATEIARNVAAPSPPAQQPGSGHIQTPTLDLQQFLAITAKDDSPPLPHSTHGSPLQTPRINFKPSPSLPSKSPKPLPSANPRLRQIPSAGPERRQTFDGGLESLIPNSGSFGPGASFGFDGMSADGEDSIFGGEKNICGSMHSISPLAQRQHKLCCLEVLPSGKTIRRELTRSEILQESRETLHKSHPSMADAAQWMKQLDGRSSNKDHHADVNGNDDDDKEEGNDNNNAQQKMESFASLVDGNPSVDRGMRREAREKLKGYLRNYLRNSLVPRDIRQVDPAFAPKPALWIRHTALVFSMEKLRAIIFRSKLLIFDPDSEATVKAADIAAKLVQVYSDGTPFELKALEALLIHVLNELDTYFTDLKPNVDMQLKELPADLSGKKLEELRLLKQKLSHLRSRSVTVQDLLEKLLDEDDDMANMYLTEKHTKDGARNSGDHDEVEMLLEAYLQGVDDIVNQTTLLSDAIEDTEDLVMIHLDTLRNRLLSVELGLSVVSMTFGVGSVVSGIFGMNLPIALFDEGTSPAWFAGVSVGIVLFIILCSWNVLRVLKNRGLCTFR